MKPNRIILASFLFGALCALTVFQIASCGRGGNSQNSALRGGWVSSGGELFKDANNPWFVANTKKVTYCIAIDQESISASPAKIQTLIRKAIGYWKAEFGRFDSYGNTVNPGIAIQDFELVDCRTDPDLRFLFGYKTLATNEAEYLARGNEAIGVAVRTEYDEVNLKGRGFIYVASDRGPFQYDRDDELIPQAWKYSGLLYRVLVHELGHVFGVPHLSRGVMAAPFLEYMLKATNFQNHLEMDSLGSFFLPSKEGYINCAVTEAAAAWFKLPPRWKCLRFSMPIDNKADEFEILGSETANSPVLSLGLARVGQKMPRVMELKIGVIIYLTPRQKVFPKTNTSLQSYMAGPLFGDFDFDAEYTAKDGTTRPLYLRFGPDGYEGWDLQNGKMHSLIYFRRNCINVPALHDPTGTMSMDWRVCPNP